jgi:alpha-1,6-mannosyltransferase
MCQVNIALYLLLNRAPNSLKPSQKYFNVAISLLIFTSAIFRAEVVLLLGPIALQGLVLGYTPLKTFIKVGLISGVLSLGERGLLSLVL